MRYLYVVYVTCLCRSDEDDGETLPEKGFMQLDGVNKDVKDEVEAMHEEVAEMKEQVVCDDDHIKEVSPVKTAVQPNVLCRNPASSNAFRRLLKYALPLPLLLMFIFGGLYLFCDDWCDYLDRYGLKIAPQLHHVRGAPPI